MCKPCHNSYTRKHYQNNKQYYKDKARAREAQSRALVSEYKTSTPCADCGLSYPAVCMDFDHLSDDKLFNIASRAKSGFSKSVVAEMQKCELVCANCHRLRTQMRVSPNGYGT
jgi:hypothetical protein